MKKTPTNLNFTEMPANELGVYLMDVQHPYLKKAFATFQICSQTILDASKEELGVKIMSDVLSRLSNLIENHFKQNELDFFPFLRLKIQNAKYATMEEAPVSLKAVKADHHAITKLFKKLRLLSNDYTGIEGSSPALRLCYAQLFNFEQDMIKHFFLEESILFPKLFK